MIQTKENIDECNNTFSKNNCSYDTNCQNEYSPTYTHLAGLDDSQMGCENHPLNIQNESNAPVPSSQNSEGKELDLKSEKEKELEDCSNPKFKDEAGDDSHNESAISSDLIGKHENSDTYICNEESCKPMAPEGGDEKLDDNQPDVPMSLEDYNTNEPIKYQDDKICENKEIEVPDNQTIDSVQSHKKNAEEILRRLRFIVSDHRLNTKSKTKNLNFFSKSKKIVDKFKAQNVKQAIALEKDNDLFNQGGCELRIPKAQLPKISTNNRRANQSSGKKQEIRREKSTLELREPFILDQQILCEAKSKKEISEQRGGKSLQNCQEPTVLSETLEQNLLSIEPKDISNKVQRVFESYLSQVSCIYFEMCSDQLRPTLNELSASISNNQNGLSMEAGGMAAVEPRQLEFRSAVRSNNFQYSTLDVLCNPLRASHVFEDWSPREIAIFETCICKFGKKFYLFPKFIKTKSTREVTDFYFSWKNTSHYKTWQRKMSSFTSEDPNDWVFK